MADELFDARGVKIEAGDTASVRRRNGSGDAHRVVWEFFHPAWGRTSWGTACGRHNLGDSKNLAANTTGKARPCPKCYSTPEAVLADSHARAARRLAQLRRKLEALDG